MKRAFLSFTILFLCFFVSTPLIASHFSDVQGHWAEKYIYNAENAGLVTGYPDGTFLPDNKISRAEFITILAKESGEIINKNTITANDFPDVPKDHWAYFYILWGKENKILSGYDDGLFRPDRTVSRQEMASLLYRYITNYHQKEMIVNTSKIIFTDDAEIGNWAKDAVYAMQCSGIISGKGNNYFDPTAGATRAETTVMMSKYIQYYRTVETNAPVADIYLNNTLKATNVPIQKEQRTILIPARTLLEAAGYRVLYYDSAQLISADSIHKDIQFWIGKNLYYRNGMIGQLQTAPMMFNGVVYIPLLGIPFFDTINTTASDPNKITIHIGNNSSSILRSGNNFSGNANSQIDVNGNAFLGTQGIGFHGSIAKGQMSYGSYTTENGDFLAGYWNNGVMEGVGRHITPTGELFIGTFQNGAKFSGTTYYADGSRFIGTWTRTSSGAIYPKSGQYIAADGTIYGTETSEWSGGALGESRW